MKRIAVLLSLLTLLTQVAQAGELLSTKLEARKVYIGTNGSEVLSPTKRIEPNDVVEYRSVYRNETKQVLRDIAATLPIPAGFELIQGHLAAKALASLDGETFAPMPLTRMVKTANGEKLVLVPFSEYRYLRWQLPELAPGARASVSARVRLSSESSVVPVAGD
jgi:hypothetical protein